MHRTELEKRALAAINTLKKVTSPGELDITKEIEDIFNELLTLENKFGKVADEHLKNGFQEVSPDNDRLSIDITTPSEVNQIQFWDKDDHHFNCPVTNDLIIIRTQLIIFRKG